MELRFDPPIPATEATAIQAEYDAPSAAEAPTTVLCNHDYSSSNAVGTYHIQRACGNDRAQWGWQLNPGVQAVVVGDVNERGLFWRLNGTRQGDQAPHTEYPGYTWHGNFNGLSDGSKVTFDDELTFTHSLGTGGDATVTLSGTHLFSDQPWG